MMRPSIWMLLVLLLAAAVAAEPPPRADLERRIYEGLDRGEDVAELIEEMRSTAPPRVRKPVSKEVSRYGRALAGLGHLGSEISREALERRLESAQAWDLLYRARLDDISQRLRQGEVDPVILARQAEAEQAYLEARSELLEPLEALLADQPSSFFAARAGALDRSQKALREALRRANPAILRSHDLPFGPAGLEPRSPTLEPAILPSYRRPDPQPPQAADYASTSLVPGTDPILLQAEALGYDPLKIYEFVRDRIASEWYAGAWKGAEETLRQGRGNDVDKSLLLAALLRASSVPCRFVVGVVERELAELADELGLQDAAKVPDALRAAGLAHRPVIRGGVLAAFEIEQTWLSAYVPYGNYRGAVVDLSGDTWIPLAPSVQRYRLSPSTAVLRQLGLDVDAFVEGWLQTVHQGSPLEELRQQVESFLAGGASYEDQLGGRELEDWPIGLLPSSLPFPTIVETHEGPSLPESAIVRIAFHADDEAGERILEAEWPLAELAGRRLTFSYQPATVADHETVNLFGGLGRVPAYLVELRPQIRLEGRQVAVGEGALAMGESHGFSVEIHGPWGSRRTEHRGVAGAFHAWVIGFQGGPPVEQLEGLAGDDEYEAARILTGVGQAYEWAWSEAERELAGLLDVAILRPLPSLTLVTAWVEVETLFGLPQELAWRGVTLDAALRASEPVSRRDDAEAARHWTLLAGLEGSALEQLALSEELWVEAISAELGLGLAADSGLAVHRVDVSNLASVLPLLDHPQNVLDDVSRRVEHGEVVRIPGQEIVSGAWRGSVWRAEHEATGGAGYFLAGGLAGGSTTLPPSAWPDALRDPLEQPYGAPAMGDPSKVAELAKIPGGDWQEGRVGQSLGNPLSVLVRDDEGRPVAGVSVVFQVAPLGDLGAGGSEVTVVSDSSGIATTILKLGRNTSARPIFVRKDPGDQHPQLALLHQIEASAPGPEGTVRIETPFTAIAFPGEAVSLQRSDPYVIDPHFDAMLIGVAGLWSETIEMAVRDSFGNPVSNVDVDFDVMESEPDEECIESGDTNPSLIENAKVFPLEELEGGGSCQLQTLDSSCGSPSVVVSSNTARGARAGLILGNDHESVYTVQATSGSLGEFSYRYMANVQYTPAESPNAWCQSMSLAVSMEPDLESGNFHFNAGRAGEFYEPDVRISLWARIPDYVPGEGGLTTGRWVRTTADLDQVTLTAGGEVVSTRFQPVVEGSEPGNPAGFTVIDLITGLQPSSARLEVAFEDALVPEFDDTTGHFTWTSWDLADIGASFPIWGVEPRILEASENPAQLDARGRLAKDLHVTFRVDPATYRVFRSDVVLTEDGSTLTQVVAQYSSGVGQAIIPRGLEIDPDHEHALKVVLHRDFEGAEVESDAFHLAIGQKVIRRADDSLVVAQEVDLANQSSCDRAASYSFSLIREAEVTLQVTPVEGGAAIELGSGTFPEGDHELFVSPADLPPGDYSFELRVVATSDGTTETQTGSARSTFIQTDSLPVGHAMVLGVDLFDGHLALQRQDLALPGRGVPIELTRSYSSTTTQPGALGIGWSHGYETNLSVNSCGTVALSGGGVGMRFVPDGSGGFTPSQGYHGTLVQHDDGSFDFYTKSGNRYHFRPAAPQLDPDRQVLDFITDPFGHRTDLAYEISGDRERLVTVSDPSGRSLRFHHELRPFSYWEGEVVTSITGPEGFELELDYNALGHLSKAKREEGTPRHEAYEYVAVDGYPLQNHRVLSLSRDEIRILPKKPETSYSWQYTPIGLQGDLEVPSLWVDEITLPEGGTTLFQIDTSGLGSRDGAGLITSVTDPRSKVTTYTSDQRGRTVSIEDPLHKTTSQIWDDNDILLRSRTDVRGHETTFTYDQHGNLETETLTVTTADDETETLVLSLTYKDPSDFTAPGIKNRVATRTDRNGNETTYGYDDHGNLTSEEITVSDDQGSRLEETLYTYDDKTGDRASHELTDDRTTVVNQLTLFHRYDVYGNLEETIDPEDGITKARWTVRSLPKSHTDANDHETTYRYDDLGRLEETLFPSTNGKRSIKKVEYFDDAGRRDETDENDHKTSYYHDLEGRLTRIERPDGSEKHFGYDLAGNKKFESSFFDLGTPRRDVIFDYDDAGRLLRRTEPLGRITTYQYDAVGNLEQEKTTGPRLDERVTELDYDERNRRIAVRRIWGDDVSEQRFRYDGEAGVLWEEDALGNRTHHTHDERNRRISTSGPEGSGVELRYDLSGNRAYELTKNASGSGDQVRTWKFDGRGFLIEHINGESELTIYDPDGVGNVLFEDDFRGLRTEHHYDARNRRTKTILHTVLIPPFVMEWTYDEVGNAETETWPNGNVLTHLYDKVNRRRSTTDLEGAGKVGAWSYDAEGRVVKEWDAADRLTTRHYDALGCLKQEDLPADREVLYDCDDFGNRISMTNPRGFETRFEYDQLDHQTAVVRIRGDGTQERLERTFDAADNLKTKTDRRGNTTLFEYDNLHRLERRLEPLVVTSQTYDAVGNVLTETDGRDLTTTHSYDSENRRLTTARGGLVLSSATYEDGNLVLLRDALEHPTSYIYDRRGLRTEEHRLNSAITKWSLDAMGDPASMEDPENRTTTYAYDLRRRLKTETIAGRVTTYGYDEVGNRTLWQRPLLNSWTYAYDDADRLWQVVAPSGTTEYEYDDNGNRVREVDAELAPTIRSYDDLDRLESIDYEDGSFEHFTYDANDNLSSHLDPNLALTTYGYDDRDRRTSVTHEAPSDPDVESRLSLATIYDDNDNPTRLTERIQLPGVGIETRETSMTYDVFDRLETVTDPWGRGLGYGYDAVGNRDRLDHPIGTPTLSYGYDQLNRLTNVTDLALAKTTTFTYYRDSRLQTVVHPGHRAGVGPNQVTTTQGYDELGRLSTVVHSSEAGGELASYGYGYDDNGNRVVQTESNGIGSETTTYIYDLADRLKEVAYPDRTVTYGLDAVGNRIIETHELESGEIDRDERLDYDRRHRLRSIENLLATDPQDPARMVAEYDYDDNGNQISRTADGATTLFHYDRRNQVAKVERSGMDLGLYSYDYQGMRIRKNAGGVVTRYLYDRQSLLFEQDASGVTRATYRYGSDRLLSLSHTTEGTRFYLLDGLRSPAVLVNEEGDVRTRYRWDAWGNLRGQTGDSEQRFGFTGYEKDEETGLYYAKARFYDPAVGRFLSNDPVQGDPMQPPSLHRYLYAYGNPTYWWDPTGREGEEVDEDDSLAWMKPPKVMYDPATGEVVSVDRTTGERTPLDSEQGSTVDEEREKGFWEKVTDFVLESPRKLAAKIKKFGDTIDDNTQSTQGRSSIAQVQKSRTEGLDEVGEAALEVGGAALEVADDALTAAEILAGAGALPVGGKALRKALREAAEAGAEAVDDDVAGALARRGARQADRGAGTGIRRLRRTGRATFDGTEVRGIRDLSHVDERTLSAMAEHGFAAKDVHGNKLVLHHLKQNPAGPVVEIPARRHSIGNRVQHPQGNTPGAGLTLEQRSAFDAWRVEYWKTRATEELARRGVQ